MIDWQVFLNQWAKDRVECQNADDPIPTKLVASAALIPASASEFQALEERLGVVLPASYKAFLGTGNGWGPVNFAIDHLRSTDQIDWFREENETWIEIYDGTSQRIRDLKYYDYSAGYADDFRSKHLKGALQISNVGDGVVLLNPEAVTPDGEWETWFFADWIPGAWRYPSFAHWMLGEYRQFLAEQKIEHEPQEIPQLEIPAPTLPRTSAKRLKKPIKKKPSLEELMEQLSSSDRRVREKTVRTLMGKLKGRPFATRRPDLVAPFCELFYGTTDNSLRALCVAMLTEIATDSAPAPLFDALSDADPGVFLGGVSALHSFPDPRDWKPLCQFIDSDAPPIFKENAMHQLAKMGDERAVPSLERVLLNLTSSFEQAFGTAAIALSKCGPRGFDVLSQALTHSDPRVRFAAVVGVDVSGDPRGKTLLDAMEHDPHAKIRDRAKIRLGGGF